MRLRPGRDLRSKFQYLDNRRGPCHSYARYLLGGARSFDTACTRMMDVRVGLIVDIHDQAIIHELHCARISAVSPGPTVKHGGAPRRGSEFTRLHARVSNSRLHLLAPATGFRRIIEIHGALPSDLSPEQRGGGRFSCLLCHFLLGEADPRDPPPPLCFSSKWTGCTHTRSKRQTV